MKPQRISDYLDLRLAIRARREELGLSFRQLGEIAGLSPAQVSRIERGGACLSAATYTPILGALGLQIVVKEAAA